MLRLARIFGTAMCLRRFDQIPRVRATWYVLTAFGRFGTTIIR